MREAEPQPESMISIKTKQACTDVFFFQNCTTWSLLFCLWRVCLWQGCVL